MVVVGALNYVRVAIQGPFSRTFANTTRDLTPVLEQNATEGRENYSKVTRARDTHPYQRFAVVASKSTIIRAHVARRSERHLATVGRAGHLLGDFICYTAYTVFAIQLYAPDQPEHAVAPRKISIDWV